MKIETGKGLEDLLKIGEVLLSDMLSGGLQEDKKEEKDMSHMESLSKAYYESLKAPERDSEEEGEGDSLNLTSDKEKLALDGKAMTGDWSGYGKIVTGTIDGVTKSYGKDSEKESENKACNLTDNLFATDASHSSSNQDKYSLNKDIQALLLHLNFKEFSGTTVDGRYVSLNLEE